MDDLTITESDFQQMVMADDGKVVTTSLRIAKYFGKARKTVLRKISGARCSEKFHRHNFVPVEYVDAKGEKRPMYELTKDGFMFVVMGFTGQKADQMKEAFINAFNWMAEQLRRLAMTYSQRRNELMLEYRQEKGIAGLAGKTLRRWQDKKPELEGEILSIERSGQYTLLLI
ncbi:Rha family transcriptional regulator [Azotobacter vinelandii]|uniref:Rha family transcriptional regulator n=1 Tax=Azotobacter vinelandii TaxID=354 RepID=UPI00091F9628|nr:Rha family transcriptional regulator [Azotobacter vinelandii]SFY16238.1 phage regulatory protein, rha family [Azotobacter vinelandii]